jgi:hypothetical protein
MTRELSSRAVRRDRPRRVRALRLPPGRRRAKGALHRGHPLRRLHGRRRQRADLRPTIAHHLFTEDSNRKIMIASLRYLDTFAKIDGSWYFAERNLVLDSSETRPSTAAG